MSEKITIVISTNRGESVSSKVANHYSNVMNSKGTETNILDLSSLPDTFMFSELYGNRSEEFDATLKRCIGEVNKFVFVIPEYNGSFPGALKVFIDAVTPSQWQGKKAGLIGLASGRAGAARAMDQFSDILNYLKVNVHYSKPKLSGISSLMTGDELTDQTTRELLSIHADQIISF